jgi:hypothetical protein
MKVVTNTEARVHVIAVTDGQDLVFKPGANALSEEQAAAWEQLKASHHLVQHHLKAGTFTEEDLGGSAAEELPLDEALKLASETLDVELLEKMKASEKRPQVLAVIGAQLEQLGPTDEQKKQLEEQRKKDEKSRSEAEAERKAAAARAEKGKK